MLKCPCCGLAIRERQDGNSPDLDLLIVDSVELAVPRYGELLAHYANLIQDCPRADVFFEKVRGRANKDFLLAIGNGLYEGLVQAAVLGRSETLDQRDANPIRRSTPPTPPASRGESERAQRATVTGYQGNPIELDWWKKQAFTVSGIEEQAVLEKLKQKITDAVSGESGWDDFRRTAQTELEAIGIELSEARLDTIFNTNLASAHGAGKWLEGQAASDVLPYWMYETVGDQRVRPEHAAQQGKCYAKNHPYWNKWFPPNGYGCRCTVTEWDKRSLDRAGIKIESELPEDLPDSGFSGSPADVEGLLERLINEAQLDQYTAENYDLGELAVSELGANAAAGLDVVNDYEQIARNVGRARLTIPTGVTNGEQMIRAAIENPSEVWGWNERPVTYLKRFNQDGQDYTAVVNVLGDVQSAQIVPGNGDEFRKGLLLRQQ